MDRDALLAAVARFPRVALGHIPTPLEVMPVVGAALDHPGLYCKRDDCTGLAFGGNKVRQLEFHFGAAREIHATTVLITGAVQSNYVRTAAAACARLGLACEVQLEERVAGMPGVYAATGNVLLNHLFGARVHHYPVGEDEHGADRALDALADRVRAEGGTPYVIHLGSDHVPLGALGYVDAAVEIFDDCVQGGLELDEIVVASGSAATHAGLLVGFRALNIPVRVHGICVRRTAPQQYERVLKTVRATEALLGCAVVDADDVLVYDDWFGGTYGQPDETTLDAMRLAARSEALVLDPVYTGKSFAGLIGLVRNGTIEPGGTTVYVHTGGTPALFAYESSLTEALTEDARVP